MLLERMIRAARLDRSVYSELERDSSANGQAFAVVLIVAVATLLGVGVWNPWIAFQQCAFSICGWLFWTAIAAFVGAKFGAPADFERLMRPIAFAHSPGVLAILALVPGLGWRVGLVAWLWTTVASVLAVQEVFRMFTGRAVLTVLVTSAIVTAIGLLTGLTMGTMGIAVDRILPLNR